MEDHNAVRNGEEMEKRETKISRRSVIAGATAVGVTGIGASTLSSISAADAGPTTFSVTVKNIGGPETVNGSPFVISPGAFASHNNGEPIFSNDEPERDNGLEEIAEDGDPTRLAGVLANSDMVHDSGSFGMNPIGPGGSYNFTVEAKPPYQFLSFVTMFVQSNDLFYTLGGPGGMDLFDGNDPVTGDVTNHVGLWDAGTEINERPGLGENQAPRQDGPNIGLVERGTVVSINDVNGYDYPHVMDVLEVTLSVE